MKGSNPTPEEEHWFGHWLLQPSCNQPWRERQPWKRNRFPARVEKSLENMKYIQVKTPGPESCMKEVGYAVKTRSWHPILVLWETPCLLILQSNLYQHEIYAGFLKIQEQEANQDQQPVKGRTIQAPSSAPYSVTSLPKADFIHLWIHLFIQEIFFFLRLALCPSPFCPHGVLRGLRYWATSC